MTETAKATDKGANLECATLSIPEAGRLVANLSVNGSYAAAARGEFGEILEFGRLRRVAKAPLLRRLGLGEPKAVETAVDDDSIETGVEERIQPAADPRAGRSRWPGISSSDPGASEMPGLLRTTA